MAPGVSAVARALDVPRGTGAARRVETKDVDLGILQMT